MRYMLLIYGDEKAGLEPGTPEFDQMMAGYGAFTEEVQSKGAYLGGEPLHDTAMARTVRVRDGKVLSTAGPFAETAEQLGGYYMLECATAEEAADYASRIPGASSGCVEIRPILKWANDTVQYLLLLYADESAPQEGAIDAHIAVARRAVATGAYVSCNALAGVASATTVRQREGRLLLSDGPFAEAKEALGGYYLVECEDLDGAIAIAEQLPVAATGAVEIRPIQVIPGWDEAIGIGTRSS